MEFTHERLVPQNYHSMRDLYYWHLSRYHFGKQFLQRADRVLDIACGTGYGSYELAFIAREVVAVDISQEAVDYAQKTFPSNNITFTCGNAAAVQKSVTGKFDVCTSFETIEHLTQDDQEFFLKGISEILEDNGYFIVSTPNTQIYSSGEETKNEFHLHELDLKEFRTLLEKYFETVFIVGQRRFEGAGVKDRIIKVGQLFNNLRKFNFKKVRTDYSARNLSMNVGDFEFPTTDIEDCLIFIAVCRNPKRK
jgi:SAM-dependent methyltransferase